MSITKKDEGLVVKDLSKEIISTAKKLKLPIIHGSLGYSGGMVFDVAQEVMLDNLSTLDKDSLVVVDSPLVTHEDIEFTQYLNGVDISSLVGSPKHIHLYVRQGATNTWLRQKTNIGQIVIDIFTRKFEEEYDESYEDFDIEGMLMYEDFSDERRREFAASIANEPSFGSMKNWKQRETFTSEALSSACEKEVDYSDITAVCNLAHDLRELAIMPNACKDLKTKGKTSKEIGESLGITPYKVGKYLLVETPEHLKLP